MNEAQLTIKEINQEAGNKTLLNELTTNMAYGNKTYNLMFTEGYTNLINDALAEKYTLEEISLAVFAITSSTDYSSYYRALEEAGLEESSIVSQFKLHSDRQVKETLIFIHGKKSEKVIQLLLEADYTLSEIVNLMTKYSYPLEELILRFKKYNSESEIMEELEDLDFKTLTLTLGPIADKMNLEEITMEYLKAVTPDRANTLQKEDDARSARLNAHVSSAYNR